MPGYYICHPPETGTPRWSWAGYSDRGSESSCCRSETGPGPSQARAGRRGRTGPGTSYPRATPCQETREGRSLSATPSGPAVLGTHPCTSLRPWSCPSAPSATHSLQLRSRFDERDTDPLGIRLLQLFHVLRVIYWDTMSSQWKRITTL